MGNGRQVHGQTRVVREETRPWGSFEVIHESDRDWFKRIRINPGQSLSYQYHENRSEFWLPEMSGVWCEVNGETRELIYGGFVPFAIYPNVRHRLFNPGQEVVSVLEWATGHPSEDDIVRIRDDYGRT
jgi:mannose-6-phosphate isomerase-like protein (cupin superfamily)